MVRAIVLVNNSISKSQVTFDNRQGKQHTRAEDSKQRPCLFAETFLHISFATEKPPTTTFFWLHRLVAIRHACIVIISPKNKRECWPRPKMLKV